MGDLISREVLVKDIQNMIMCDNKTKNRALELVHGQPTAYDVDKVVERIEARRFNFENAALILPGADIRAEVYAHAIKIVKEGAIKDD